MRLYEGMYIVSMELASQGWEKVEETVSGTITRFNGTIVRLRKWGERVFTYPIQKQDKGVYVLVQFKSDPSHIEDIKGRVELDPNLLRVLIVVMNEAYAEESFEKEANDGVTAEERPDNDFYEMDDLNEGDNLDSDSEDEENECEISEETAEVDIDSEEDADADKEDEEV